jgi:hypothetical protein
VGNSVFLQDAEFHGPVDFISATIGSQINMDRSTFSKGGTFEGVKVGRGGFFLDIILKGNLVLGYADFMDLYISGRQTPNPIQGGNLYLSRTRVQRELEIVDLKLENLIAPNLRGQGQTTFKNLMIGDEALFQNSSFQTVNFINVAWGERDCTRKGECRLKVNLDGMTYHSIQLKQHEKGLPDIEGLKRLVEDSYFNFENYVQLEAYFKRGGAEEEADEVYRAGKHRQLTWRPKDICIWIFWDLLTGYGRDPWRIVWISLAIIVFGMMVFDPRYLDVENFLNSQRTYVGFLPVVMVQWLRKRCFWRSIWESLRDRDFWKSICVRLGLSLDIFVPTENPGVVDHLRRPEIPTPVFVYFFFHKLAGLTLIPLFAAAAFLSSK